MVQSRPLKSRRYYSREDAEIRSLLKKTKRQRSLPLPPESSDSSDGNVSKDASPFSQVPKLLLGGLTGAAISVSSFLGSVNTYHNQYDIPNRMISGKKALQGEVVKVVDGDTVRVRHLPNMFSSAKYTGKLSDETIMTRIIAVDCPEIGKRGKEGQPFADAAKQFTTNEILHKKVKLKLIQRDRYGRLLATVKYPGGLFGEKDLSAELLKKGLAVVYRQGGAQYDGQKKYYEALEGQAQKQKKGMWSVKNLESPSAYKKRAALSQ